MQARWRRLTLAIGLGAALGGCRAHPERRPPSILLAVLDTTRVDAVSAYGGVRDTTPTTDALAAGGLRYTRAYTQAPWTLPAHATLFTGLLPNQHGVSWRRTQAPDALRMLAEQLRDAGYETMGVSENPWVSAAFNMTQGFERFALVKGFTLASDAPAESASDALVGTTIDAWLHERRADRPFLLFVNVLDAHMPYLVRAQNPFLPPGVSAAEARAVSQNPAGYLCSAEPHAPELAILRGLYLGGVAAADAKLGDLLARLHAAGLDRDLVTIVTADHGEHFGEHRLVGHQFSVHEALVHVPLVVHGLPGVPPAVIDTPVGLTDVVPTVLGLAGVPVPAGLAGRALPTTPGAAADTRALIAEEDDSDDEHASEEPEIARLLRDSNRAARSGCSAGDPVFGEMRAILQYPLKLVWYARYPAELYDLSTDPHEERDLAAERPSVVAALSAEVARHTGGRAPIGAPAGADAPLPPDVRDRLRALGYVGDGADGARASPAPAQQ